MCVGVVMSERASGHAHRVCLMLEFNSIVQNNQSLPLNCDILVGPNCNIEYRAEGREVSSSDPVHGITHG